ncbi:MAG: hypothetical protein ABEJ82_06985 [Haloplanus sp.]
MKYAAEGRRVDPFGERDPVTVFPDTRLLCTVLVAVVGCRSVCRCRVIVRGGMPWGDSLAQRRYIFL